MLTSVWFVCVVTTFYTKVRILSLFLFPVALQIVTCPAPLGKGSLGGAGLLAPTDTGDLHLISRLRRQLPLKGKPLSEKIRRCSTANRLFWTKATTPQSNDYGVIVVDDTRLELADAAAGGVHPRRSVRAKPGLE